MIENFLALLQERPLFAPVGLGALLIALFWLFGRPNQTSGFRVREADLRKGTRSSASGLAEARFPAREPLALPGISITGAPHEILGIAEDASAREIQAAYLERVKRYHPDKVGAPGTRQWNDAQKIAVALNRARDEMLAREKRRSSDSRKA